MRNFVNPFCDSCHDLKFTPKPLELVMLQSPPTSDNVDNVDNADNAVDVDSIDDYRSPNSSRPFHGLVLCCTSIEADLRSEIAQRTADMGGVHKYDLTPDVTHLVVGDYNTAKYRHVAKERSDIKPMAAGWVDAVRRLWVEDQDIDFAELEALWKLRTFESGGGIPSSPNPAERGRQRLVCCLTGFEDSNVRAMIEDTVKANGGEYVADLSRRVTHLVVSKPEGKKYSAARRWDIRCVSIEWLHDSVERGMILDEECYDPTLPPEERGKGAWSREALRRVSLGKRAREGPDVPDEGRRKLRKSASMRMNSQSNNIWGDILNQSAGDLSRADDAQRKSSTPAALVITDSVTSAAETSRTVGQPVIQPSDSSWPTLRKGVFAGCRFFVHGFPESREQVLLGFLTSHSAQVSSSLSDVASLNHAEPVEQRYLLVPQTSQPDSHPQLLDGVHIITEFFVERCIHNKTLFHPRDHVWGQPFPRFPIDGFQNLTICTAGFANEQLNQIEKTVTQLGATYSEKLNRKITLLVCPGLSSLREQKRDLAIYHGIPIINVEWLWQCITTGCLVPWDRFQFEELTRNMGSIRANLKRKEEDKKEGRETINRSRSEPVLTKPPVARLSRRAPAPPPRAGVDMTAFDSDIPIVDCETSALQTQETRESHYETAPTHPPQLDDAFASAPLSEITASSLNKSTSPSKQPQANQTLKCFLTEGEEAGEESDATTRTALKETPTCGSETECRRKAQQAKDLERLELSKRLNFLMANDDTVQGGAVIHPGPGRRKRQILGRATSNVSVASSASADSASASGPKRRQLASAQSVSGGSEFDKFFEPAGEMSTADTEHLPPSTQLEYDIPEARKQRDFVLERMKIMKHGKQSSSEGRRESQSDRQTESQNLEKVKLSDLDPPTQGKGKEVGVTRRSTRRQGRQ
ncbi:hypothetical protein E0Z10_g10405 [Xylaria hypoxylon]|uniref:BRCT domain-containing protein n=1 Tax=Xylaria hypoxylon TaxID=37992 RepID=A0A4Z0Y330_9PEZI|nr:hypothetical protein E0Z10_g10405 [Xylaria hypoxylon]